MARLRHVIRDMPVLGPLAGFIYRKLRGPLQLDGDFSGSEAYWEDRYASGGHSGAGSYGPMAEFKADVLNRFVSEHRIETVIEFGCGDGHQLSLASYPRYSGYDVSSAAVERCRARYASDAAKTFALVSEYDGTQADLALSLDVIYHLVEDAVFEAHLRTLFAAGRRYVIVYSSDIDQDEHQGGTHERHRRFTPWITQHIPGWRLLEKIPNALPFSERTGGGSPADFYVYARDDVKPPD